MSVSLTIMEIKPILNQKDLERIADLYLIAFTEEPYNEQWTKEKYLERVLDIHNITNGYSFYAEENGKIIGFMFCQKETWSDGKHLIIEDLAIHPDFRGKGIGSKLVKRAEEIARHNKMIGLDLFANKKARAFNFWQKQGYHPTEYVHLTKNISSNSE